MLCALGAGDDDLAQFFGISAAQLQAWKERHETFRQAVQDSRDLADKQVERSLFERATGYSHPEDKVFANAGKPLVVPTSKHYPPDPTSMMFWLKNRQPLRWRERVDHEVSGKGGGSIKIRFVEAVPKVQKADKHDDDSGP